jgi:hypothetical protein
MLSDSLPEWRLGIPDSSLGPFAVPIGPLSDPNTPDLGVLPWFRRVRAQARGRRGHGIPAPIWRALRLRAVGTPIWGHDVSGAGWQTAGRVMPVRQCGHSRRDRPVSASKRSR